jgi:Cytochrome P460
MHRILIALFSATLALLAHAVPDEVAYPEGYRAWYHVKSMVIAPGHPLADAFGGMHHLYANPKALAGYRNGRFADGSTIVFDLREAKSAEHTMTEGARKIVGVMTKDSRRFAATGGWGFEGFKGDTRERAVGGNAAEACFGCHTQKKERGFVFSELQP